VFPGTGFLFYAEFMSNFWAIVNSAQKVLMVPRNVQLSHVHFSMFSLTTVNSAQKLLMISKTVQLAVHLVFICCRESRRNVL
jgi:hypothetical protein